MCIHTYISTLLDHAPPPPFHCESQAARQEPATKTLPSHPRSGAARCVAPRQRRTAFSVAGRLLRRYAIIFIYTYMNK